MSKRTVRVYIPYRLADKLILLGEHIVRKHKVFASDTSPLSLFDMVRFEELLLEAKAKRDESRVKRRRSEALRMQFDNVFGREAGLSMYSRGTVYYYVFQVRDQLLALFRDNAEELGVFGFDLVITYLHGRHHVRVKIPAGDVDGMFELCDAIMKEHRRLGVDSPLNKIDMVDFGEKLAMAKGYYEEWYDNRSVCEGLMQESNAALGMDKGQTAHTEDTVYNMVLRIRDQLLVVYRNDEEALSEFGFDVVISSHLPKGRGKKVKS